MKKLLKKENLFTFIFILVVLHPVIELDYLLEPYLGSVPRLTTVIDFVILPILVVLVFFFFENHKKKVLVVFGLYIFLFGLYFVVHCLSANNIQNTIHLTTNFYFNVVDEVVYTVVLLLPLAYIYVFNLSTIGETILKKISILLSTLISVPIFLSNILTFGMSTYVGYTKQNIFSWFSLPYNAYANHPRKYATKFFFEEGNTIGILLAILLPLMFYFFYTEKSKTKKVLISILILIQSLSMLMLSTRLATYCSALIPLTILVVYIILLALRKEKLQKAFILLLIVMTAITSLIIPYGPAYQNQLIDAQSYSVVKKDDGIRSNARELLQGGEKLGKWSEPWRDFYVYMFEDYKFLMNVTPPIYYIEWYDYKYDPQFWVDLIFDYELEERINGRQIETIFTNYKWDELSNTQKLVGLGYGTFMRGGINIERDFIQQYYSFGPVGVLLIMGLWIVLVVYSGIKILLGYKDNKWTLFNIVLFMSICLGLASGIVSGHTFDELTTSLVIGLYLSCLLKQLKERKTSQIVEKV